MSCGGKAGGNVGTTGGGASGAEGPPNGLEVAQPASPSASAVRTKAIDRRGRLGWLIGAPAALSRGLWGALAGSASIASAAGAAGRFPCHIRINADNPGPFRPPIACLTPPARGNISRAAIGTLRY